MESGVALSLAAALQDEAAASISSGIGRFGGHPYSLEYLFSATQAAATQRQRECQRPAGRIAFGFTISAGVSDRHADTGSGCR